MASHTTSASPLLAGSLLIASGSAANELAPSAYSGSQSENGQSASDADTSSSPTELMVHTRTRRSNAGNRMSKLIAIEEADDIGRSLYEALEDVPDDDDFSNSESVIDADDISLESSAGEETSDNEGHVTGNGELEGEKELEKEERNARRAVKRKAHDAFLKRPGFLKRAKLRDSHVKESTSTSILTPTPAQLPVTPIEQVRRKKSERVSWLDTEGSLDNSSRRLSSRSSTLKSRAETHQRLLSKERTRLITVATMKAAEERREALKQKPLTQADRLAEAARMERLNARSLNRWEEAERKKVAERRARLEAQRNRCIEGEFIRFWSGSSEVKKINGRPIEVTSSRISLPSEAILATKTAERSEAQDSLPPPIPYHTGNTDADISTTLIVGQLNVAMEQNPSVNLNKSGNRFQPFAVDTVQTLTAPMRSTLSTPPKSNSTSQSLETEKMQGSRDAPRNSPALLEGIHYWTTQPTNDQQELSTVSTPTKPTTQTNPIAADSSSSAVALTHKTSETGILQRQRNGDTVSSIPAAHVYSSQLRKEQATPPVQAMQQPALPLTFSQPEEQPGQRRQSRQRSPYPPNSSGLASSEKRTYSLIVLNNIDPAHIQNSNARDRDREKDLLRSKLFGWPTSLVATAGAGPLGAMTFKSMHISA